MIVMVWGWCWGLAVVVIVLTVVDVVTVMKGVGVKNCPWYTAVVDLILSHRNGTNKHTGNINDRRDDTSSAKKH